MNKLCFLVPVFNHTEGIRNTVARLAKFELDCIVIDDGSDQDCHDAIATLALQHDCLHVIHRLSNFGKGAAVKTGLERAAELGFTHALQVDADEQHDLSASPELIEQSNVAPNATILARTTALCVGSGLTPNPSRITSSVGRRGAPDLFVIECIEARVWMAPHDTAKIGAG